MAASTSRSADRMIQQDYIARIRYSNALPPPPNPPKLLDIPNTGLASGQYTTPGFASRLAREQPLNIEADAELGMPLDLVGMPGVFDGDESSIQAPLNPNPPHPHDRPLLRSLRDLGKPRATDASVSFLRRTEYISSHSNRARFDPTTAANLSSSQAKAKKPQTPVNIESPEHILASVEQSFEIAAQNLKNPSKVRHPSKRSAKLLGSYPLIPDLEGIPDPGGYVAVKFFNNPVPPSNVYDTRLESGILRPLIASDEQIAEREAQLAAWQRDPDHNKYPDPEQNYEFYLTETAAESANFKRKCDVLDPDRDDEDLYTYRSETGNCFRFKRIRAYETASTSEMVQTKYNEEILVSLNDGVDGHHQRAAYYYPVIQRTVIRPQRKKNIEKMRYGMMQEEESDDTIDLLDITVREPDEEEARIRQAWADDPFPADEEPEKEAPAPAKQNGNHAGEADEGDRDADAEGDEDDTKFEERTAPKDEGDEDD